MAREIVLLAGDVEAGLCEDFCIAVAEQEPPLPVANRFTAPRNRVPIFATLAIAAW
jgi:hypothetical protein